MFAAPHIPSMSPKIVGGNGWASTSAGEADQTRTRSVVLLIADDPSASHLKASCDRVRRARCLAESACIRSAASIRDANTLPANTPLSASDVLKCPTSRGSAKVVDTPLIKEIYEALEGNGDIPKTWQEAKHTVFMKVFGPKAR